MATNNTAHTGTNNRVLASDMTGNTTNSGTGKAPLGTGLTGQQRRTGEHKQRKFRNVHEQLLKAILLVDAGMQRPAPHFGLQVK